MSDYPRDSPRLADVVGTIGLHSHLVLIYETQDERFSAAVPFIKNGLERGEKCFYIADVSHAASLSNAMRAEGIDVDAAIRQGHFTIANREIYPVRGEFDADRAIKVLEEWAKAASSAGYSALRVTGEMTWATGIGPHLERLVEYEAKLNHFLRDHDALAICQYDREFFQPDVILNILRTHPTVVYGKYLCENPYYMPPEEFLDSYNSDREIQRMLARMRDDTATREKLRRGEERLRESSEQYKKESRALIDAIPQQIWSGPADGSVDFCNERWRSYTGLTLEELQGDGWQRMLHPKDLERVLQAWRESVEHGTPYEQEERHRGVDGRYRWFLSRGVPTRDPEGRIIRWYGTNTDIDERKRAEEEVGRLSGRLLKSQDEERRRIARDLHDSTGQDLVALAMMLGQLRRAVPSRERKSRKLLSECKTLADKCVREVRTLSYVLHPAALDQAGLKGAIRDYVKGFAKRSGVQVDLELSPRLGRMSRDIELALFRVVQEALTNIQRHSGSQHAKIRIDCNSRLTLEIIDNGNKGLRILPRQTSEPAIQFGVGIPSMQERVNLIGGRLEIESTDRGTTVRVVLPFGDEREKASHSSS